MLDRLTKRPSDSEVHPHEWQFRDYSSKKFHSRSSSDLPTVPSPYIFRDVALPYSLRRGSTAPPTFEAYPAPGHIASHLLLVECFHKLRTDIESSSFLKKHFVIAYNKGGFPEQPIWQAYLEVAIKRFKLWISKIEPIIRHSAVFNKYGTGSHLHGAFTENYLPPLDVLLIWFCYLQNTASYERLLASNNFILLSQICFPWHVLPKAINQETLEYSLSPAAERLWQTFVGLPADLKSCIDLDLDDKATAFTSHDNELLQFVMRQTDLFGIFHHHQWLRSPALAGTIQRAINRYADAIIPSQLPHDDGTQQLPVLGRGESHSVNDLKLDVGATLVLQTHKAYHSAWKVFSQNYNLRDDERPPPPSYNSTVGRSKENVCSSVQELPALDTCFCWVCERIKDEIEEAPSITPIATLTRVLSLADSEEKKSVLSFSSSDTGESNLRLGLTQKQIKMIKREISVYRHVEMRREKRIQGRQCS